ncbi:MAG: KR domain-containing protein, partial [bacterium]|nr:KR domain-containing protein [bacterium]
FGQVAYCSANAFQDSFANYMKNHAGIPVTTINWDIWGEVGMAAEAAQQKENTREVEHPLYHRCISQKDREIYIAFMSAARCWLLDEHRVIGKATMPGTGCLEMVRAAFQCLAGPEPVEIREAYFLSPMMLEEKEEREVHTILEKKGEEYEYLLMSRSATHEGGWQEHAKGRIGRLREKPPQKMDITALKAQCSDEIISGRENFEEENLITFGPRWHTIEEIRLGKGQGMARLNLDEQYRQDLHHYRLHPALLDIAVGYMGFKYEDAYLPFSYKKLKIYGTMPATLYSYYKDTGDITEQTAKETRTFDILITDEEGNVRVEIREYTILIVSQEARERTEERIFGSTANEKKPLPTHLSQDTMANAITPPEGIDIFRRVLAAPLPQVAVSMEDLHEMLKQAANLDEAVMLEELEGTAVSGPAHPRPELSTPYTPPTDDLEKKLAGIWQSFIGIDGVGIYDDFFELGGDSLKIITVLSKTHKELKVKVPMAEMFKSPTI